MLDMSWGEVMLIGGVALIVIGPKDLPKALRTLGQITTKVRRMAGEFQHQFNEAIREADLDEIKRDVEGVKRAADNFRPSFNPVDTIRNELKSAVEGREAARKGETIPDPSKPDLMQSTASAALARGTLDPQDQAGPGASYDVPRPLDPIVPGATLQPPAAGPDRNSTDERLP